MSKSKTIPTRADLDAILPAIEAIARTTPFAFAKVEVGGAGPSVSIELPTPGSPITVEAHIAYGSVWEVSTSGASFRLGCVDDIRMTAAVLGVAQALVALLVSIPAR